MSLAVNKFQLAKVACQAATDASCMSLAYIDRAAVETSCIKPCPVLGTIRN